MCLILLFNVSRSVREKNVRTFISSILYMASTMHTLAGLLDLPTIPAHSILTLWYWPHRFKSHTGLGTGDFYNLDSRATTFYSRLIHVGPKASAS